MAYTKVEITDTGILGGYSGRNTLVQESDGTFWTFIQKTADDYLYAAYSTDQGATWTIEGSACVADASVEQPSVAIDSSDNLHLVYEKNVTYGGKTRGQIFYRKRTKGGSWGTEYNFTPNDETLTPEVQPRIVVDSLDHLYVVFSDSEDVGGTYRYYIRYTFNAGSGWETLVDLIKDVATPKDYRGLVFACGAFGRLHLFFYEFNIDTEAYRLCYMSKWGTWSAAEEVSTDVAPGFGSEPAWDMITEQTRSLYVVWVSEDYSKLYGRENLRGVWQTQETVASLSVATPALAYDSEDTLWLLFQDNIDNKENIYMMSRPKGGSWTEAVNISGNTDTDMYIRCPNMLWQKVPYFCKPNTGFYAVYAYFKASPATYKQYLIYDDTESDPTVEWGVPEVTTQAADEIAAENGTYTAKLHGTVVHSNSEPLGCKVLFQYGKSTDSGDLTWSDTLAGWKHTDDTFELVLTGLDADTMYMFRAVGRSNRLWDYSTLEGLGFGMWLYFKTSEPTGSDTPEVTTDAASAIGLDTATLNGTLDEDNGDGALCWFFWGDPAFIHFTHDVGAAVGHVGQFATACVSKVTGQSWENVLTGLLPATKYAYFSCAQNSDSLGIGDVVEFSTLDPQDPSAEGALGVVGSLQHEWRPGHYELRIGLGGFGKAEITIAAAGDDEEIDEEPDLQSPEAVEDAAPTDPLGWIVMPPFPPWMDKVTPTIIAPTSAPIGITPAPVPTPTPPSSESVAGKTVDWVKRYVAHTKRGAGSPMGEERGRTFYNKHRYKRHYRGFGITIGQSVWGQLQNLFHNTLKGLQGGAAADYQHLTTAQVAIVDDAVQKADFDAQTVLAATVDDTPAALTVTEQTVIGRKTGGDVAALPIGIADDDIVEVDGSPEDGDYAKFTAAGLEGRTAAEAKTDLGFMTDLSDDATPTLGGDLNANDAVITALKKIVFTSFSELTISSGAITVTQAAHSIDTEADAAEDNLDTISGGTGGQILFIRPEAGARHVWVRHLVDNIFLQAEQDVLLDSITDGMFLMCLDVAGNKKWFDVTKIPAPMVTTDDITIYVDSEASGDANGRSWTDAFTTIQAAWDSLPTVIAHDLTITVRAAARTTGTADSNVLNKLHDTGVFTGVDADWETRWVFNLTDETWGYVKARDSEDQLSIGDKVTGADLDLFPAGTENYVILGIPYRETELEVKGKYVIGSVSIEGEYSQYGDCSSFFTAVGRIVDLAAPFGDAEVGDAVFVYDYVGARIVNYDYGTITAITTTAMIETDMAVTPDASWDYVIARTRLSGCPDGCRAGADNDAHLIEGLSVANITLKDFAVDTYGFSLELISCDSWTVERYITEPYGSVLWIELGSSIDFQKALIIGHVGLIVAENYATVNGKNMVFDTVNTLIAVNLRKLSYAKLEQAYWDTASKAVSADENSAAYINQATISANTVIGLYARHNSAIKTAGLTNNAATPVDPVGTSEGAYIS